MYYILIKNIRYKAKVPLTIKSNSFFSPIRLEGIYLCCYSTKSDTKQVF